MISVKTSTEIYRGKKQKILLQSRELFQNQKILHQSREMLQRKRNSREWKMFQLQKILLK